MDLSYSPEYEAFRTEVRGFLQAHRSQAPGHGGNGLTWQKLLIAHGANVNLPDRQRVTPLAHAEQRGQRAISVMLRAAGAIEQLPTGRSESRAQP